MKNRRLIGIIITIIVLLSIPLIAMQFTNEVNWTLSDFIVAGILLFGTGIAIEVIARNIKDRKTKIGVLIALSILFFLVWVELAVGIFNKPFAGS